MVKVFSWRWEQGGCYGPRVRVAHFSTAPFYKDVFNRLLGSHVGRFFFFYYLLPCRKRTLNEVENALGSSCTNWWVVVWDVRLLARACRIWQPLPWNKTSAASLMSQHEMCHTASIVAASIFFSSDSFGRSLSSTVYFTVFETFHIFPSFLVLPVVACDMTTKTKNIKKQNQNPSDPPQWSSCSRCVWRFVCCQLRAVSRRTLQPRKVATSPSTPRSLSAASPAQRGLQAAQDLLDHPGPWVQWVCQG